MSTEEQRAAWRERMARYRATPGGQAAQARYNRGPKGKARNREVHDRRGPGFVRKHGMLPEDWAAMWDAQQGRCYLCGADLRECRVHIDHDHRCCPRNTSCPICRRGLACHACNTTLGNVRDDPARLRRMADAIEAATAAVDERMAGAPLQLEFLTVAAHEVQQSP
jgi:hypothetical protein